MDLVAVGCFEGEQPSADALPDVVLEAARRAAGRSGFAGRRRQRSATSGSPDLGVAVSVTGLGRSDRFDRRELSAWIEDELRHARSAGYGRVLLAVPAHDAAAGAEAGLEVQRRARRVGYRFSRATGPARRELEEVALLPPEAHDAAYRTAEPLAEPLAAAEAWARDLGNTPPNEAHPAWIAAQAEGLAAETGMECEVFDREALERHGMGGLLAVGGGSRRDPRLVRLAWGEGDETIAVVGKGITFDTGGISLKPPKAMDEMKFDKCGACAALGIARGAAALGLPGRFRVFLPLAENMPDGAAYRPGDIVTCYGGKTVEILNTDAEGRMVLADALVRASEEKPDVLLDFATLTGACVVALGPHAAGLFTEDDELAAELTAAGEAAAEPLWRLPLWAEFGREMAGRQADLRNVGGRWGGANTAAAFLANFVEGSGRWAHLDIAGTAWRGPDQEGEFGASGFGVALTLLWLLRRAGRL
ncbi:MAG: leucyl aminopeptidase [Thermoanaerobaculia bacterium]|nr:leucyl aminopeptidase [Thermoanaerobaculia bacterium]